MEEITRKIKKQYSGIDDTLVRAIVEDLTRLKVICDSRKVYQHFHVLSENPMYFSQAVTFDDIREYTNSPRLPVKTGEVIAIESGDSSLKSLLVKRSSCRGFSHEQIEIKQLCKILEFAYSIVNGTIPSAGGLYPTKLYLIVTRDQSDFKEGYYEYDPEHLNLIRYQDEIDNELLQFAFDNETLLFNAPVIIVLAADCERQPGKYSNRGYRYTLLEAGHVAQNLHLAAAESGLATLEYGGFLDKVLADELDMPSERVKPIISVAIGYADTVPATNAMFQLENLERQLVGSSKPIRYVRMTSGDHHDKGETFFGATALHKAGQYQDARRSYNERFAAGTATSSSLAQVKAIAEAYERYASGIVRVDFVAKANEINRPWLDPRQVVPFSSKQYELLSFLQKFDENKPWEWVIGHQISTGQEVYVPVDLAFYPLSSSLFNRRLCYEANSSGVAAFTEERQAIHRALLELVERDCVIRNWFKREAPPRVRPESLTYHLRRRIAYWQSMGRDVFVLDMSDYGVATVNVVFVSKDQFPCFINGSAASGHSFDEAATKAFQEAELALIHALRNKPHRAVKPDKVFSPTDHAKFYALPEHLSNLEWLWSGEESNAGYAPHLTNEELLTKFDCVSVRLSPENSPLHVVRVISENLVPINFGYGADHYLHHKIYDQVKPESLLLPHYFA